MIISTYRGVAICVLAAACQSEPASEPDSAVVMPSATSATTAPAGIAGRDDVRAESGTGGATPMTDARDTARTACPHTGRWALCSVEKRLRQAGFVVKPLKSEPIRRAGFSVMPAVYTLGRAHVELFLYPDEASLARDIAGIDTILVAPVGAANAWGTTPVLVRSGNLAAVLLSQNQRQAERFLLAITAGAPQPGSPR